MKPHAASCVLILSFLLIVPTEGIAKRDLEDEIQDFTVAQRAFQDKFYEFTRQELERFIEYYPHSEQFQEAKLLLGRTYLELGKPHQAFALFSEMLKEEETKGLRDQLLYWSGELHLRAKDLKAARQFYQELIEVHPQSSLLPYAVYSLGWCQEAEMKFEAARKEYAAFILRFPEHPLVEEASMRKIVCLLREEKFEETLERSRSFLEKYPASSRKGEVLYLRGEAFTGQGDFGAAVSAYEEALQVKKEDPHRLMARLHQGWAYFKLKDTERALSIFKELLQEKEVEEAALFGTVLCYRFQEKFEEALSTLEELLNGTSQGEWRHKALLERAEIYYRLSRTTESAGDFRELLLSSPTLPEAAQAHYGLGWVLLKIGETEEAISEFQWVSQRAPEVALRVQALCRIGDLYQDRHEFQKARESYAVVLKEYSFALEADYAAYQSAQSYLSAEEFEGAINGYEEFLSKFPKSIYRFQALYDLGSATFHLGRFEKAQSYFEEVRKAHPTDELYFSSLFQIGNCLYNLKGYEKALVLFEEVGAKGPERIASLARYETGWCLYQMGKREEAMKSFEGYLSRYPDSDIAPDILFWFAEYYERQKEYDKSEKYFKSLLEKYPTHPLSDEVLFRWSTVASERKMVDRAIELIDQLISRYPNSPLIGEASLRKSELLFGMGKKREGRQLLDQLLVQTPESEIEKRTARKIGDLLKEENRYEEAIVYLEKAKTGDAYEPNAQIQFEIGECYEALGKEARALEEFLRLAYLYPKSTYWVMRSYLKIGALFEKQGKWEAAAQTYEKLTGSRRLEEAKVARERLKWIREQVLTTQKTP